MNKYKWWGENDATNLANTILFHCLIPYINFFNRVFELLRSFWSPSVGLRILLEMFHIQIFLRNIFVVIIFSITFFEEKIPYLTLKKNFLF